MSKKLIATRIACLIGAAMLVPVSVTSAAAHPTRDVSPVYVVTSTPGAQFYGYTAPAVVIEKGGQVTYVNLDIVQHDLVQDPEADGVGGPKKEPWCKTFRGKCPVFWTPKIGIGQDTEVLGLENVKPGATYSFLCTLHPGMRGVLVVTP